MSTPTRRMNQPPEPAPSGQLNGEESTADLRTAPAEGDFVSKAVAMHEKPFFTETVELLNCVRDHDFRRLSEICDDDFGIVDITTDGGSLVIRDRVGWENWFTDLFNQLDTMSARTWSDITGYEAVRRGDMGYSVVDFDQALVTATEQLRFSVVATVIWKRVEGVWKESRYHSSLVGAVTT